MDPQFICISANFTPFSQSQRLWVGDSKDSVYNTILDQSNPVKKKNQSKSPTIQPVEMEKELENIYFHF